MGFVEIWTLAWFALMLLGTWSAIINPKSKALDAWAGLLGTLAWLPAVGRLLLWW